MRGVGAGVRPPMPSHKWPSMNGGITRAALTAASIASARAFGRANERTCQRSEIAHRANRRRRRTGLWWEEAIAIGLRIHGPGPGAASQCRARKDDRAAAEDRVAANGGSTSLECNATGLQLIIDRRGAPAHFADQCGRLLQAFIAPGQQTLGSRECIHDPPWLRADGTGATTKDRSKWLGASSHEAGLLMRLRRRRVDGLSHCPRARQSLVERRVPAWASALVDLAMAVRTGGNCDEVTAISAVRQ